MIKLNDLIAKPTIGQEIEEIKHLLFIEIMYQWKEQTSKRKFAEQLANSMDSIPFKLVYSQINEEINEIKEKIESFINALKIWKRDHFKEIQFRFMVKEAGWLKNERSGGAIWIENKYGYDFEIGGMIRTLGFPENMTQDLILRALSKLFWIAYENSLVEWNPSENPFENEILQFEDQNSKHSPKR